MMNYKILRLFVMLSAIHFICSLFAVKLKSETVIQVQIADTFAVTYPLKFVNASDEYKSVLKIGNPSLIYPLFVRINNTDTELHEIARINDSTFSVYVKFSEDVKSDIIIEVICEALAGNDSISVISFSDSRLNSDPLQNINYLVLVNTLNNELPYLRFPTFLGLYPNPLYDNSIVNIEYINDVTGDVDIYIYDGIGRESFVKKSFTTIPGVQKESIVLSKYILSGLYRVELRTKFGRISKPIIVIK